MDESELEINKFEIQASPERRTPAEIDMALFAYSWQFCKPKTDGTRG